MKRIIQFALLSIIIISILIFNKIYFSDNNKKVVIDTNTTIDKLNQQTENNIIKNLKYEVKIDENNWYIITSDFSELTYINDIEKVKMQKVVAKFIDKKNLILTIKSDEGLYDNSNYNTKFRKNVQIDYMKNKIFSDKIDLNFQDNTIKIFENVKYIGAEGEINSDNIMINLITKKVDIYMNNENDNVEITKN
tara:strand:- start:133 stop:711 length:579 start_codon:yes stop_codon:yes gene_type:complete